MLEGFTTTAPEYDPLTLYDDPYPTYRTLRDWAPVYHNATRSVWTLSRFDDVRAAARDWNTFSSASGVDADETKLGPGEFLSTDPPRHEVLRGIVRPIFAPRRIKLLEDTVRTRVHELLDPLIESGGGDFATDFARRLPLSIVSDLFGVPPSDRPLLEDWFMRIVERIPGEPVIQEDVWAAVGEMQAYVAEAVAERRARPRDDLLTAMASAQLAGQLSLEESEGMWQFLLVAGVHTTETLIANGLQLLEPHAGQRRQLADYPVRLPAAIEELLRYDAPVQWLGRVTTRDVTLHDVVIPRGERVLLLWASANRDERAFHDPDQLILDRPVERHLAFGEGIHFCLGAPLARIEARAAFEAMFTRVPEYELAGPIRRMFTRQERGISHLPLRVRT
jgi:cytochrome P450